MTAKPTCAFCGWRDAVAWAARDAKPFRICAKCNGQKTKAPTVIGQVRAIAPTLPSVTVAALLSRMPRAKRTAIVMACVVMQRKGELVVVQQGRKGPGAKPMVYEVAR